MVPVVPEVNKICPPNGWSALGRSSGRGFSPASDTDSRLRRLTNVRCVFTTPGEPWGSLDGLCTELGPGEIAACDGDGPGERAIRPDLAIINHCCSLRR